MPSLGSRSSTGSERSTERRSRPDTALSVEVVPMRRRHLRSVLHIETFNAHKSWSLGLFLSEIRLGSDRVYAVAKVGQTVVGFAGMLFSADEAHVTNISVHPDWRRLDIGTRLMLFLARSAREFEMTGLTLEVRASNRGAHGFYRQFGLAPVGSRKNYYSHPREDALIMWVYDIDRDEYAARLDRIDAQIEGATVLNGWDR